MATLKNWAIVRVHFSDKKMKSLKTQHDIGEENNLSYHCVLMGECYGDASEKEGSFIYTHPIKTINDSLMITMKGQIYELKNKMPDYEKFEKAVTDGITICKNWSIHREKDSCYLKVSNENGEEYIKKIISRDGWMVTFDDDSIAFLDWASVDDVQLTYLKMFVF